MRKATLRAVGNGFMLVTTIAAGTMTDVVVAAPPVAPAGDFVWKDGTEVYAKVCAYCHDQGVGPVIRGRALPPVFISATWFAMETGQCRHFVQPRSTTRHCQKLPNTSQRTERAAKGPSKQESDR